MSTAAHILEDQVIHVKRGRANSFGFEPAWNAYFDFYLSTKYFGKALLELEDVTFHLFLRKNLNDNNPNWKMPTIRQMKKRFGISQAKLDAMLDRLEKAHLLKKESGVGKGPDGKNARNEYLLSDPIPTLAEFLQVAAEGVFDQPLLPEYIPGALPAEAETSEEPVLEAPGALCIETRYIDVSKPGTSDVPKPGTDQQTLNNQQTAPEAEKSLWENVLEGLRFQMQEATFKRFLDGAILTDIQGGTAIIATPQAYDRDWIENRLSGKLTYLLTAESGAVVDTIRCVCLAT